MSGPFSPPPPSPSPCWRRLPPRRSRNSGRVPMRPPCRCVPERRSTTPPPDIRPAWSSRSVHWSSRPSPARPSGWPTSSSPATRGRISSTSCSRHTGAASTYRWSSTAGRTTLPPRPPCGTHSAPTRRGPPGCTCAATSLRRATRPRASEPRGSTTSSTCSRVPVAAPTWWCSRRPTSPTSTRRCTGTTPRPSWRTAASTTPTRPTSPTSHGNSRTTTTTAPSPPGCRAGSCGRTSSRVRKAIRSRSSSTRSGVTATPPSVSECPNGTAIAWASRNGSSSWPSRAARSGSCTGRWTTTSRRCCRATTTSPRGHWTTPPRCRAGSTRST